MFPVRDINPAQRTPFVTYGLIAVNVALFAFGWWLGPAVMDRLIPRLGVVPSELLRLSSPWELWTPLTSMFVHAGWLHLLGNVWFLHIFGDNVEDHLGHARYLALYLLAGLCAVVAHVVLQPSGTLPLVGASGAIAGVLGAYVLRFPRAPILAWFVIAIVELPAWVFLFVWFGYQLWMTVGLRASMESGGVAFAAHAGGFVAGMALDRMIGPSKEELERQRLERRRRVAEQRKLRPHRQWLGPE